MLCFMPTGPEDGKWTLLGPSLDWHALGAVVHGFIFWLLPEAYNSMESEIVSLREKIGKSGDSLKYLSLHHWNELRGSRSTTVLTNIKLHIFFELWIYILGLAGQRFLTSWALVRSRDYQDPCQWDG